MLYCIKLYNRKQTRVKTNRIGLFFRKKLIVKIGSFSFNKKQKKSQLQLFYNSLKLKKSFSKIPKVSIRNARIFTLLTLSDIYN